jgi:type 1 fimbria pilin
MQHRNIYLPVRLLGILVLGHAGSAAAATGCDRLATSLYHLGNTVQLTVSNTIPVGEIVRDESATGDGNRLATCYATEATLVGENPVLVGGGIVPLKVGGLPSGFGIEVEIQQLKEGQKYPFPHTYMVPIELIDAGKAGYIYSSDVSVRYVIRRMTGPVIFGPVDRQTVAVQKVIGPTGVATASIRQMDVHDITFVRPGCSISSETLNQTVAMGSYNIGNFATPDRATPWVPFRLTVEECQDPIGAVASMTFGTPADQDAINPALFSITAGGSQNVALELGKSDKSTIEPGKLFQLNALGTGEHYEFNARFKETRPTVMGGNVNRPVLVKVEFQ